MSPIGPKSMAQDYYSARGLGIGCESLQRGILSTVRMTLFTRPRHLRHLAQFVERLFNEGSLAATIVARRPLEPNGPTCIHNPVLPKHKLRQHSFYIRLADYHRKREALLLHKGRKLFPIFVHTQRYDLYVSPILNLVIQRLYVRQMRAARRAP